MYKSIEEIIAALDSVSKGTSDIGRVYSQFAKDIQDKMYSPATANLVWEFAIFNISSLKGAVPMLGFLLNMRFNELMTAVFSDDPEFLAEIIKIHEEISNV